MNIEKIKTIIDNSKKEKINKLTIAIAERKIKEYYDGADQRSISLGIINDLSILLEIPLKEMFLDSFLEKLCKTNTNI